MRPLRPIMNSPKLMPEMVSEKIPSSLNHPPTLCCAYFYTCIGDEDFERLPLCLLQGNEDK